MDFRKFERAQNEFSSKTSVDLTGPVQKARRTSLVGDPSRRMSDGHFWIGPYAMILLYASYVNTRLAQTRNIMNNTIGKKKKEKM